MVFLAKLIDSLYFSSLSWCDESVVCLCLLPPRCLSVVCALFSFTKVRCLCSFSVPILICCRGFAREIFEKYLRAPPDGLTLDSRLCGALIRAFHDGKDREIVRIIFDWMRTFPNYNLFDPYVYTSLFQFCANTKFISLGKAAFEHLEANPDRLNYEKKSLAILLTASMNMFGRCGGRVDEALKVYEMMLRENIPPTSVTFVTLFDICTQTAESAKYGKEVYAVFLNSPLRDSDDLQLNTAMLKMYGRIYGFPATLSMFYDLKDSGKVFDAKIWTQLVALCMLENNPQQGVDLFDQMLRDNIKLDGMAYQKLFEACSQARALEDGIRIFNHMQTSAKEHDLSSFKLWNAVIEMFGYCDSFDAALGVFQELRRSGRKLDAASWNILFTLCAEEDKVDQARDLWREMITIHTPIPRNFLTLFDLCTKTGSLDFGKELHKKLVTTIRYSHSDVTTALVNMYAKCDSADAAYTVIQELRGKAAIEVETWNSIIESCVDSGNKTLARKLFREIQQYKMKPTIRSWNLLIATHIGENASEILKIFNNMLKRGLEPNKETYTTVIGNCMATATEKQAEAIHKHLASRETLMNDPDIASLLQKLYAQSEARQATTAKE